MSDSSKASVALSASAVVGSLTIWATGMVEFIAMNTRTGADLAARDVEATSEAELKAALSRFIDEFVELAEIEHE